MNDFLPSKNINTSDEVQRKKISVVTDRIIIDYEFELILSAWYSHLEKKQAIFTHDGYSHQS